MDETQQQEDCTYVDAEEALEKMPIEYVEASYRRGYRDGWIKAANLLEDIWFIRDLQWIYDICYDHWTNTLWAWANETLSRIVEPPYPPHARCVYCGAPAEQKDHVVPKSRGGPDDRSNLVLACRRCNYKKGNRTPEECGFAIRRDWPPTP